MEHLDIKDNTISIDAAGCQKPVTKMIVAKNGYYVLGLKRNHPKLYSAIEATIQRNSTSSSNLLHDDFEEGHARLVRRRYFGYDVSALSELEGFAGGKSVVAVETISSKDNDPTRGISTRWRYYLLNHQSTNRQLASYVRNHWSIENKLHWTLDVHLKEDDDQKAERKSVRSFALLKRITLNIVRSNDTSQKKRNLRRKLKRSGWDFNLAKTFCRTQLPFAATFAPKISNFTSRTMIIVQIIA